MQLNSNKFHFAVTRDGCCSAANAERSALSVFGKFSRVIMSEIPVTVLSRSSHPVGSAERSEWNEDRKELKSFALIAILLCVEFR